MKIGKWEIEESMVFKTIAFLIAFLVSMAWSILTYTSVGTTQTTKLLMLLGTIAIDSGKALMVVTIANSIFSANYYQRKLGGLKEALFGKTPKKKNDYTYVYKHLFLKNFRTLIISSVIYVFLISASLSATIGNGIVSMYQYNQQRAIATVESSKIAIHNDQIANIEASISQYEGLNATDQDNIASYEAFIATLGDEFVTKKDEYYRKISALNEKIMKRNETISDKKQEIIDIRLLINEEELLIKEANTNEEKSMFDLVAEAVSTEKKPVSPADIMFLIIVVFAAGLEIIIFYCSPHKTKMNEEKDIVSIFGETVYKRMLMIAAKDDRVEAVKVNVETDKLVKKVLDKNEEPVYTGYVEVPEIQIETVELGDAFPEEYVVEEKPEPIPVEPAKETHRDLTSLLEEPVEKKVVASRKAKKLAEQI